jgi:hypothetical protein
MILIVVWIYDGQSFKFSSLSSSVTFVRRTSSERLQQQRRPGHHSPSRSSSLLSLLSSSSPPSIQQTPPRNRKHEYNPKSPVRPIGTAVIDYSMAEEYVLEHYQIPHYFRNGDNDSSSSDSSSLEPSIRREKIFDAREGVVVAVDSARINNNNNNQDGEVLQQQLQQRPLTVPARLDECGFELFHSPTKMSNFRNLTELKQIYEPELRNLISKALVLTASDVNDGDDCDANTEKEQQQQILSIHFWHPVLRGEEVPLEPRSSTKSAASPIATMAHIDTDVGAYGVDGVCNLVDKNQLLDLKNNDNDSDNGNDNNDYSIFEELLDACQHEDRHRVVLLNIWRPLVPVTSSPLGIFATQYDIRSTTNSNPNDETENISDDETTTAIIPTHTIFPNAVPNFNTSRWYIYSNMQPDECLIFKQYDRRIDKVSDLWHCALTVDIDDDDDDDKRAHTRPRKSFDIKAMVVLKEQVPRHLDRFEAAVKPRLTVEESGEFCNDQASRVQQQRK